MASDHIIHANWDNGPNSEVDLLTAFRTISSNEWGDAQSQGDCVEIHLSSQGQQHRDLIGKLLERAGCTLTQSINT